MKNVNVFSNTAENSQDEIGQVLKPHGTPGITWYWDNTILDIENDRLADAEDIVLSFAGVYAKLSNNKKYHVKRHVLELKDYNGTIIYSGPVYAPSSWSVNAVRIYASKYMYTGKVPDTIRYYEPEDKTITNYLPVVAVEGTGYVKSYENSVFHTVTRLAGAWTWQARLNNLFGVNERGYHNFFISLVDDLLNQKAIPNSPQWFNTGLNWLYGVTGDSSQTYYIASAGSTYKEPIIEECKDSYSHPQVHACFIQRVDDSLKGIMELMTENTRLFKFGSGTGTNFSTLRAINEPLSTRGVSSGVMSFLNIGDVVAGAVKSGGATRRAAKMVSLDADHPEIMEFIDWKYNEEMKMSALSHGTQMQYDAIQYMIDHNYSDDGISYALKNAGRYITEMHLRAKDNKNRVRVLPLVWGGEAVMTMGGQNSNNTVRVTDDFMNQVENNVKDGWELTKRTGGIARVCSASDIFDKIAEAAWASGDPALHFSDAINYMNTCDHIEPIRSSNPCSEYLFLDNTACNLAALNVAKFIDNDPIIHNRHFDVKSFVDAAYRWTYVLDLSIDMASYPNKAIALGSANYRALGLGYTNLGGAFIKLGIPYGQQESLVFTEAITALLNSASMSASSLIGRIYNSGYPKLSPQNHNRVLSVYKDRTSNLMKRIETKLSDSDEKLVHRNIYELSNEIIYTASEEYENVDTAFIRNAQHTLLAPNGTTGLVMDNDSTGLEPIWDRITYKTLTTGEVMRITSDLIDDFLHAKKVDQKVLDWVSSDGKRENFPGSDDIYSVIRNANEITWKEHVDIVAAAQMHLSGGISKTINVQRNTSIEDIKNIYMYAWKKGVKSIALFRDGSKATQPLQTNPDSISNLLNSISERENDHSQKEVETKEVKLRDNDLKVVPRREQFPNGYLSAYSYKIKLDGVSYHVTIQYIIDDNGHRPWGVFINGGRLSSNENGLLSTLARAWSLELQYGVPVNEMVNNYISRGSFPPSGFVVGHPVIKMAISIVDLVWRDIAFNFLGAIDLVHDKTSVVPLCMSGAHNNVRPIDDKSGDKLGDKRYIVESKNRESANEYVEQHNRPVQLQHDEVCPSCGAKALRTTGTCKTCQVCGSTTGCA